MRIVIELRRDANANVILNNLFKHTAMQSNFSINMLALVDGQPKVLTIKECLKHYLDHQRVIIRRRTEFEKRKAEARAHILEGLRIALDHIDEVISLIRNSKTTDIAREGLMEQFQLSEKQAQAILDMRLQRLTGLEREKIEDEYAELRKLIAELKAILADEEKILEIIRKELTEIKEKYNDERRSEIVMGSADFFEDEDLIPEEKIVITLTHKGYIKRLPSSTYRTQRRGGRGVQGMEPMRMISSNILFPHRPMIRFFSLPIKEKCIKRKAMKFLNSAGQRREFRLLTCSKWKKGNGLMRLFP